jgi:hypothetical protein
MGSFELVPGKSAAESFGPDGFSAAVAPAPLEQRSAAAIVASHSGTRDGNVMDWSF